MKTIPPPFCPADYRSSVLSAESPRAEGILSKVQLEPASNYCHSQFPAIREQTLYWDQAEAILSTSTDRATTIFWERSP